MRAAQWLAGLAIVAFAARALLRNWTELRSQPLEWRVEPGWLLLSALVVWLPPAGLSARDWIVSSVTSTKESPHD